MKNSSKSSWKPFIKSFIPVLYLFLVFGLVVSVIIEANYVKQLSIAAKSEIVLESDNFKNEVNSQVSNVLYLADILQRIREFIPSDEALFTPTTEGVLADFIRENAIYDQVRFLDNDGMETVRINWVNGEPHVVPVDELQDKSDRYFYQESLELKPNEVYISKFDLNMEYLGIELPIKPVYRLITPIDLSNGERLGYVVVNILGQPVLDRILEVQELVHGNLYLINEDGAWIIAPPGATAWGFMYGDSVANSNISQMFPEIWQKYHGEELFQGFSTKGFFTFNVIDPLNQYMAVNNPDLNGISHENWILISYIPLPLLFSEAALVVFFATIFGTFVLFLSFRQVAENRRHESLAYQAREDSEKKLDIISESSQDAIILTDQNDLIEYWNKSAERLFGYSADEVLGKGIHIIIPKLMDGAGLADPENVNPTGDAATPGLKILHELEVTRKDGTPVPVEISINPVLIDGAEWSVGIVRDISERRLAEKAIRELAQFPLENANIVMRVSQDSTLLFANPASEFLIDTLKMKVGKEASEPICTLAAEALDKNERIERRMEIGIKTYLFSVFPVAESQYVNIYAIDITQEEKTRRELEASELKYRMLLNTIPQYVFHKDKEGRYITINSALSEMIGFKLEDVQGKTDFEIYRAESAERHRRSDLEAMEKGVPIEYDLPLRHGDPDGKVIHIVKAPVFDKNGNVDGVLGIFWDITQRVKTENELASLNRNLEDLVKERTREIEIVNDRLAISERRYRAIIENQVEFVFRWDLEGNITYANQSIAEHFKKNVEEIEGFCYRDVINSEGMDRLYALMHTISKKNPLITTEIRNVLPDGRIVWEQWNSRAIFDQKDEIVEIQNVGHDITELKQAQEQLALQSTALEAAANGIVITDRDGAIIWANQSISNLTGYSLNELTGKTPRVFKSGRMTRDFYTKLWDTITAGKVWKGEVVNRKKDGSFYMEEMVITPVSTEKGKITNFIAIKQDVTERKAMEDETRRAKEQAELANRAKSTFLANMSHEIRTPLNAISGLNYLLKRTGVNDIQRQYLDKMQSASKNLLDTINDVLDFSKIEAEKIEIENVTFSLDDVILDITDTEALKAHQKGIELIVSVNENIPERLEGDPIRLKQVLRNLTNNAVKFTEKGEVVIEIEKEKEEDETITLRFCVTDTGIGLTEEQIQNLFIPFQQADISTTRKYGGTGLGLAISKRIVELMRGEIYATSQIGQGSTFTFVVPFKKVPPKKNTEMFLLKEVINKKVLIVDSNTKSSQWLARLLKPTQAEITQVGDLETLHELLDPARNEKPFDVVLVNNNVKGFRRMSDLAGIKQHFPNGEVKVIHLTDTIQFAQQLPETKGKSVDAILIKPINASQLYDTWLNLFAAGKHPEEIGRRTKKKDVVHGKSLRELRILLVEDNEINQDVIGELLRQSGAIVAIAANGAEAVAMIKEKPFDLVLMDVQMPVMDGFKATSEIRKDNRFTELPIIALTANAQTDEKRQAKQAGMNDYITKPIEPKLLFNVIAHWTHNEMPEPQAPPEDEMPELRIKGVDTDAALRRLNNDEDAYLQLLEKFIHNHKPDLKEIAALLDRQSWEEIRLKAHAVRGAALNLGVGDLGEALKQVEQAALDKDTAQVKEYLGTANKTMDALRRNLKKVIDQKIKVPESSKPVPVDYKKIQADIDLLLRKVQDHDPVAKSLVRKINQSFSADQFEGTLIYAQLALEIYDFKKAEAHIVKALELIRDSGENE
jgi:PAS domain S-box-containing protein